MLSKESGYLKLDRKVKSEINKFIKLLEKPKTDKQKVEEYFKQCPFYILVYFASFSMFGLVVRHEKEEYITIDTWNDAYKANSMDSLNTILDYLWQEKSRCIDNINLGMNFYLYNL